MPPHRLILLALTPIALALPAAAQAPDRTGTGGGIGSAITAPNTAASGRTKPPGRAAAPKGDREERTANEKRGDSIDRGICIGCDK